MLSTETKERIIKEVINDIYDIYIDLPKDYLVYIVGQSIDKTERALLFETGQMIDRKIMEIKEKKGIKDDIRKPIVFGREESDFEEVNLNEEPKKRRKVEE